ncbi:MAG: hypothetical protein E7331_06680 [Clostridiales bacterium]|nr:hypothetical protein [Clostridiales bacterium]
MKYAWITEAGKFAHSMNLLGKPCRYYVEKTLKNIGFDLMETPASFEVKGADMVVAIREDAVCMDGEFLTDLLTEADAIPFLVPDLEEGKPLAFLMNGNVFNKLIKGKDALPALDCLMEDVKKAGFSVHTMGEDEVDLECMPITDGNTYQFAFTAVNDENIGRHMENGVVFLNADNTIVEPDVEIGEGTIVYPGNILQGNTRIGQGCTLYPNNRMNNAVVGDYVTVESSILLDCSVGERTTVGPYAYLRPKANIGNGCRIGDFVEIKNSNIDDGTKVSHLAYVGDSDLGKGINVSCGVVFSNYDGKTKNRCVVEDNAFLGCNCNLVAPVHVGRNAYLAAGSTVVENVPEDALLIARARGTIKDGWVKRRKEAGKL